MINPETEDVEKKVHASEIRPARFDLASLGFEILCDVAEEDDDIHVPHRRLQCTIS
jgi:hypothetical protein